MKKKFENFLKQLGDSPKKKRNILQNSFICEVFSHKIQRFVQYAKYVIFYFTLPIIPQKLSFHTPQYVTFKNALLAFPVEKVKIRK